MKINRNSWDETRNSRQEEQRKLGRGQETQRTHQVERHGGLETQNPTGQGAANAGLKYRIDRPTGFDAKLRAIRRIG